MINFILKDLLLGLVLLILAFWLGSQESVIWGFAGFLPFFILGIVVIIHGWKTHMGKADDSSKS